AQQAEAEKAPSPSPPRKVCKVHRQTPSDRYADWERPATVAEADRAGPPRLSPGECEHLEESLRSAQQASADLQGALDAFRKDRRLQGPMEDPLELLEWKAPREREAREATARPLRAVLAVKRPRAAASEGVATDVQTDKEAQPLVEYGSDSGEEPSGATDGVGRRGLAAKDCVPPDLRCSAVYMADPLRLILGVDLAVRDAQTFKVKPGLSDFAKREDLEGCRLNIQDLVNFANKFVAAERRPTTPVLLKATAGLRAVPEAKAEAVLRTVRSTLKASGYQFQDAWADIIKGKEEAALAWIAANYLGGSFDVNSKVPSMGVIEMGGGSTQVSFEVQPDEFERVAELDRFQFKTGLGRVYSLYAHSYLGFGQDYAQSKLQDTMGESESSDPCYPVGYARVKSNGARQSGSGDSTQCRTNIRSLLFQEGSAPGRYEHELPVRGHFAATENFYYVRNDLQLPNKEGVCPTDAEAKEVCGKSLADSAADRACFALSYQLAFLGALGAVDVPGIEVEVQRKINGGDIDWALGAALAHLLSSRVEPAGFAMTMPVVLTLVVALALLAAAFSLVCRPKSLVKGYESPTLFGSKSTGLE
ncbi:APY5, partial [Symbiodinium pilosum]